MVHLVIKSAKNENKINLADRLEEACSMNIYSKNQLDSANTFLVIVVTVSKIIVLRKTRLKLKFKHWVSFFLFYPIEFYDSPYFNLLQKC